MFKSIVLGATVICCLSSVSFATNSRLDLFYHLGNQRILYEGRTFLPLIGYNDSLIFADIRAVNNPNVSTEFNMGLASRKYFQNIDTVFGAYYFYDHRKEMSNLFKQNVIGVEMLGKFFEARINTYLPFKKEYETTNVSVRSNRANITKKTMKAMSGNDIEVGIKLPIFLDKELWFYWGAHKFTTNKVVQSGQKVRTELNFANTLPAGINGSFGVEYSYGNGVNNNINFVIGIGIPFYQSKTKNIINDYRMIKPIVRDIDVKIITQVSENYQHATIKDKQNNEYDYIEYVSTEEELQKALKHSIPIDKKQVIILTKDIYATKVIKIDDNRKIISGTELKFDDMQIQPMRPGAGGNYKLFYTGKEDIWDNTKNIKPTAKTKVIHNDLEYEQIVFVDNEDDLLNKVKEENTLIVLTKGFTAKRPLSAIAKGTKVFGAGTIKIKNGNNIQEKIIKNDIVIVDGSGAPYKDLIQNNIQSSKFAGIEFDSYTIGERAFESVKRLKSKVDDSITGLKTKASQSDFNSLKSKVDDSMTGLSTKASQSDFNSLKSKIDDGITGLKTKASQSDFNSLKSKVDDGITGLKTKASQSDFNSLKSKVDDGIIWLKTKASQSDFNSLKSKIDDSMTGLSTKASQSDFNSLKSKIDDSMTGLSTKASQSDFNSLKSKIDDSMTGLKTKASQSDFNSLKSKIDDGMTGLSTKASQSDFNSLKEAIKISPDFAGLKKNLDR